MRNLNGQQIGPYKIEELIGVGGMAEVYRARQSNLERSVAVKVLKISLADDPEFLARFIREAMAAGGLHHPNILRVYDAGTFEDLHYMAMDYASGGTLAQRAAVGPLSIDEAAAIGTQLADALDYAHGRPRPVIHRDLKPSNILLEGGRPLLADFGIAYQATTEARLTQTGVSLGTPEYMSPEQCEGYPVDGRTDIYSLGVVLYQLVTGRVPFQAHTAIATLHQVVYNTPPAPREFRGDVPEWLESIILRALAKRPADRFATAGEMAAALRDRTAVPVAVGGEGDAEQPGATLVIRHMAPVAAVTVQQQPVSESSGRRRTPLIAVAIVAVVALLGAAAFIVVPALHGGRTGAPPTAAAAGAMDFETMGPWQVSGQQYGTLSQSSEQVHTGSFSAKLTYDLPPVDQEYVLFQSKAGLGLSLPGAPDALTLWVYGDGSGHYLNVWVKDAAGQMRQFSFGRVTHRGWQQMTAPLDPSAPWPQTYIAGPDSNKLTPPLSLVGLMLDAVPHNAGPFKGVIYLDTLGASGGVQAPAAAYGAGAPAVQPTPKP
jgi:hypothetical protein